MQVFTVILLGFLLVCAVSVSLSKNLLNSILIYMSYSLVMSIIWILLESPDLAITEAAVGAGITSVLFFITLKKIHAIVDDEDGEEATEVNVTGSAAATRETEANTAGSVVMADSAEKNADRVKSEGLKPAGQDTSAAADVKGGIVE